MCFVAENTRQSGHWQLASNLKILAHMFKDKETIMFHLYRQTQSQKAIKMHRLYNENCHESTKLSLTDQHLAERLENM